MNEPDNFSLVRRPPGALVKTEPGAKRILSGMIADALALATRKPSPRIVVVYAHAGVLEHLKFRIKRAFEDATILTFEDSENAWQELLQKDPDLLIADYRLPGLSGKEILQRLLGRKATYPIIVTSAFMATEWLTHLRECRSRGLNVVTYLHQPFDHDCVESALEAALKIPRDAARREGAVSLKSFKLVFSVAIFGNSGGLDELLVSYIQKELTGNCTVQSNCFTDLEELLNPCCRKSWESDLFIVFLNPELPSNNGQRDVRALIADLKAKWHRPIVIISNEVKYPRQMSSSLLDAGADAFFPMPLDLEHLGLALTACGIFSSSVEVPTLLQKARPLRIVVVNDEQGPLHSLRVALRDFKDVTLLLYQKFDEAWQELSREDPGLLIMGARGIGWKGQEIAQRLLERQTAFPIIVTSAYEPEEQWVQDYASQGLNVTFLHLPFDIQDLRSRVETALKVPRNSGTANETKPIKYLTKTHKSRGKVLIVFAEEGPRLSLRVLFKEEYDLFSAEDGPAAIKLAQENDIDVVVTDLRMAGMSGIEVLEQVKSMKPDIEVIILTAYETPYTHQKAFQLGASDYINLPFDIPTMRAAVSRAMQCRKRESEIRDPRTPSFIADAAFSASQLCEPASRIRKTQHSEHLIFVVDDEDWLLEMIEQLLASQGYQIRAFQRPEIALQEFISENSKPDLIITGLNMGRLSGFDIIEQVKRIAPKQKILMMSGMAADEFVDLARSLGVPFLAKPFTQEQLMEATRSLLDGTSSPHE